MVGVCRIKTGLLGMNCGVFVLRETFGIWARRGPSPIPRKKIATLMHEFFICTSECVKETFLPPPQCNHNFVRLFSPNSIRLIWSELSVQVCCASGRSRQLSQLDRFRRFQTRVTLHRGTRGRIHSDDQWTSDSAGLGQEGPSFVRKD